MLNAFDDTCQELQQEPKSTLIPSNLDLGDALFSAQPAWYLQLLQLAQNTVARTVYSFHWLPVYSKITHGNCIPSF